MWARERRSSWSCGGAATGALGDGGLARGGWRRPGGGRGRGRRAGGGGAAGPGGSARACRKRHAVLVVGELEDAAHCGGLLHRAHLGRGTPASSGAAPRRRRPRLPPALPGERRRLRRADGRRAPHPSPRAVARWRHRDGGHRRAVRRHPGSHARRRHPRLRTYCWGSDGDLVDRGTPFTVAIVVSGSSAVRHRAGAERSERHDAGDGGSGITPGCGGGGSRRRAEVGGGVGADGGGGVFGPAPRADGAIPAKRPSGDCDAGLWAGCAGEGAVGRHRAAAARGRPSVALARRMRRCSKLRRAAARPAATAAAA